MQMYLDAISVSIPRPQESVCLILRWYKRWEEEDCKYIRLPYKCGICLSPCSHILSCNCLVLKKKMFSRWRNVIISISSVTTAMACVLIANKK